MFPAIRPLALLAQLAVSLAVTAPVVAAANPPVVKQATAAAASSGARLTLFAPQGEMRTVRQVQARFSEDMVRFGDPRVFNPFTVICPAAGKGRWVDTRNWAYDFAADLPAGIACEFTLVKGLRSVAGRPVTTYPKYRFSTGGPLVTDSRPRAGISYSSADQLFLIKRHNSLELAVEPADRGIEEEQVFMLKFDGEVDKRLVPVHAYCLAQGLKEKIPVRLLSPEEERAYLAMRPYWEAHWWQSREPGWLNEVRRPVVSQAMVSCRRRLPNEAALTLVWDRGIAATSGIRNQQDQLLAYQVRPEFTASFSCDRESARKPCSPLGSMRVEFTEEISAEALQKIVLGAGEQTWRPQPNGEGDSYEPGSVAVFQGPFMPNSAFTLALPGQGFGNPSARPLKNQARFPLAVKTGDYPPLAKFSAGFGIVERAVGAVPLTVRNLEPGQAGSGALTEARLHTLRLPEDDAALIGWLKKDAEAARKPWGVPPEVVDDPARPGRKITRPAPPDPRGDAFLGSAPGVESRPLPRQLESREFEVLGIPVPAPGIYVHEVESRYLGNSLLGLDKPMYVHSISLVTNLAVHFKRGVANSLVWVTALDKAEPVPGAAVEIRDCNAGELLWRGITDAQGISRVDARLPETERSEWIEDEDGKPLQKRGSCNGARMLVSARTADDRSFVLSNWDEGIQPWRYAINHYFGDDERFSAHTVLARTLLRAGETVHMRHFLRQRTLEGFAPPATVVRKVALRHEGSDQEYELTPRFDAGGNADSEWKIPAAAKLGRYAISLHTDAGVLEAGNFRVAEFRLPLLKARLQIPAGPVAYRESLDADLSLAYLNGGAYPGVDVILRGEVDEDFASFPDYEQFSFRTCVDRDGNNLCPPPSDFEASEALPELAGKVDAQGGLRLGVPLPARVNPARATVEMQFTDPGGETQTVYAVSRYWPGAYLPGIKVDSWVKTGSRVPVDVVVLDTKGLPVRNAPVQVKVFLNETLTHRTRTVGGFYAYNSESVLKPLTAQCAGRSDAAGRLHCDIPVNASGELHLRAQATDPRGQLATASASAWVSGQESWWFGQENTDRIDLIPEKKSYEPGQAMRLQLRMPFPQATVLVTTEREGILDASVQRLTAAAPVITVPARGEYAPNVYVSALAVRGRDDSVQPTALVDLGKPAFKMGLTQVKVGWDAFRLAVAVEPERKRYRIREQARVKVKVTAPGGQALPAGTEITLAAVDEALLELSGNASWDLLKAMMGERGHRISTSTSQLQVVGKRHFGRKALPPGGGGGRGSDARELFDTLLYWKARAPVDAQGVAEFTVPINDSLSGFRLAAVASAGDRFGVGESSFQTFQDLQVISGLPLVVREGDRFDAGFTVRNASDARQSVKFTATTDIASITSLQRELVLAPGQSQTITFPVQVPAGIRQIEWVLAAVSENTQDRMKLVQKVLDSVPEQVIQATLTQLEPGTPYRLPVQKPSDALDGGGLDLSLRAHLGDGLAGVQRFFRDYRYSCLEQQLSRAIALDDRQAWLSIQENLPAFLDGNGLLKLFTPLEQGDPLITAYVLEVVKEAGWEVPKGPRERMLGALERFVSGELRPRLWDFAPLDKDARKLKAISVLARYQRYRPVMLESINVQPGLWPTAMVLDWVSLLQQRRDIAGRDQRLAEAAMILRTRLNLQGTALMLSRNESNQWWLYSSADVAAVRLFLAAQTLPGWQEDLPRLIRGLDLRSRHGHWDTTLANAWAVIAMKKFSERFESVPVSGSTRLVLAPTEKKATWAAGATEGQRLAWPARPATLEVAHDGQGKPWLTVQSVARIPLKAPWSTGYAVERQVLPLQQKVNGQWSAGDVALVVLKIDAQTDMGWVVVEDPVPAGASLLGRGLDRDSELLRRKMERYAGWMRYWSEPSFAEYRQDSYRGYYERVSKGPLTVAYVVRLNQSGDFQLPPTRVEAMYAPEMFGMIPNAAWSIVP
ncbi:MAG: alpha-2-macroglobulin [Moraxellaceae bacterium]|jgi:uncharacterized protein YfaS (alpha-2-macroglobulin family)|nr:alpha-2-macroglobulin [Moraxellaceae bacterium]